MFELCCFRVPNKSLSYPFCSSLTMPLERSSTADLNMDLSLETILEVSPYGKEEELKVELRKLSRQEHGSGTKIVLFNLTW